MSDLAERFPHLGKLSIAILEHYVKPILGDDVLKEIKSAHLEQKLQEALAEALSRTEQRFLETIPDRELADAVRQLPLADLPSMAEAVKAFHDKPTDTKLYDTIRERLIQDLPSLSDGVVDMATEAYIRILRQELVASIPSMRDQLVALANLGTEENTKRIVDQLEQILALLRPAPPQLTVFNLPPRPPLVVGREEDLQRLKEQLGVSERTLSPPQAIVRGWPGVGKTTLVNRLAHEADIAVAFPDGVLWTALGENPSLLAELSSWGRVLGISDAGKTLEESQERLTAVLRDKEMLLIVDDVYETAHALPFRVAGARSVMLFTTRFEDVANALAATPAEIYQLPILSDTKALELFGKLTPDTVAQHPQESAELVADLEGLPLAIQVAGRLLEAEISLGWGVADLLKELRESTKLMNEQAPADRTELSSQTTPTVAALLRKSTDRLTEEYREQFAFLGAFAPKPATFDLNAMAAVWVVADPKPTIRALVARGLLEPVGERFQMHSLLVMHARSMLE